METKLGSLSLGARFRLPGGLTEYTVVMAFGRTKLGETAYLDADEYEVLWGADSESVEALSEDQT